MAKKLRPDERRVKLLVCIVGRQSTARAAQVCADACVSLHFAAQALGTAKSNYMSYFGLHEIEKSIVYSLIPAYCEKRVLLDINRELKLYLNGNGIAFTVPLSGISNLVSNAILSTPESRGELPEGKGRRKEKKTMHELIIAVVHQKYTDPLLEAARGAGATGATLLHSLGLANDQAEQVLGRDLKEETDTVAILTTHEFKARITDAIREVAGLKTDGGTVLFSLPVDELIGIGRFSEEAGENPEAT